MRSFTVSLLTSCLLISAAPSQSADWGPKKSSPAGNSIEITAPGKTVNLIWPSEVVAGDELLLATVKYGKETFYKIYTFTGVAGGSITVKVNGAHDKKGSAKSDSSFDQNLFIEPAPDGSYYFIPSELRNEGHVKVTRAPGNPSYFVISVGKTSR